MLTSREVILVKLESSYNTDPTPDAANDAVLVESLSWANESLKMVERKPIKSTFGKEQSIYAGTLKKISIACEIKGSGAAGTAPEIGALLQICGLSETVSAGVSVTYAPTSTPTAHKSATIYYYQDGTLRKLTGCRGDASFTIAAGDKLMANFEITGHQSGTLADSAIVTPTYDGTLPVKLIGLSSSVGTYAAVITKLEMKLNNQLAMPGDINGADGFSEIRITGRDINGSLDPEATLVATKAWEAILEGGTQQAIDTGVIGSSAGNRTQLQIPYAYFNSIAPGDRDKIRTYDIGYAGTESAGDDEFSLAFT